MIKSIMVDGSEALKLIVDGEVVWERSGLPTGYRRCAYLESTGEQIIDTLYHPIPPNTRFEFEFTQYYGEMTISRGLMGTRKYADYSSPSTFNIFQSVPSQGDGFRMDVIGGQFVKQPFMEKVKCIIDARNNIVSFNGVNIENPNFNLNDGIATEGTFKLFNFDTNGSVTFAGASIRIHSFVIYNNDIPTVNFVPCLDNAGRPCMYDTVTKQPFYNVGSSEFLYELE